MFPHRAQKSAGPPPWLLDVLNRRIDTERDHARQIRELKAALDLVPDVARNHRARSKLMSDLTMLLWTAGDSRRAITWCRKLIKAARAANESEDFLALSHLLLGNLHRSCGQWTEGLEAFQIVLQYFPGDTRALHGMGWIYDLMGRPSEAFECLQQAADDPRAEAEERGLALGQLGDMHARRGEEEKAVEFYRRAEEIGPEKGSGIGELGSLYLGLRRFDEAEKCLLRAIELDPANHAAPSNLGYLYWVTGRNDDARRVLAGRIEWRSWDALSARLALGCLEYCEHGGANPAATAHFQQVLAIHATDAARNHTHPAIHDADRALALIALDHGGARRAWEAVLADPALDHVGRACLEYLQEILERLAATASPPPLAASAAAQIRAVVAKWQPPEL